MKCAIVILTAIAALSIPPVQAARAPLSDDALEKEAVLVVSGSVTSIRSEVKKSEVETAAGVHRDRIYTITVKVTKVAKGDVKVGEEIVVQAWIPVVRLPPLPGLQGHSNIPTNGQKVTFYLTKEAGVYKPILPNGIADDTDA